jgi:hypothetical protein
MNVGGAEQARAAIVRSALEWMLGDARPRVPLGDAIRPPLGRYRSTYWGLGAEVTEVDGTLILATASSSLGAAASASRLVEANGRWRADGGMFDGSELDFDITADGRRFCGGLYPFEFLADDAPEFTLPTAVVDGWIRAQFGFDIAGFGFIEMHARLGLTSDGLEGLLDARHPTGELAMPAVLTREGAPPARTSEQSPDNFT